MKNIFKRTEDFYNTPEEELVSEHYSAHLTCIIDDLQLDIYEHGKGLSKLRKHDAIIDTHVNDILTTHELAPTDSLNDSKKGGKSRC